MHVSVACVFLCVLFSGSAAHLPILTSLLVSHFALYYSVCVVSIDAVVAFVGLAIIGRQ